MAEKKAAGGLPFVGNMSDGIDFVRRMWGVTGLPGLPTATGITQFAQGLPQSLPSMITPTLDVGELDKRITDLRAVEQWLALNANMLRATIQSLEVQRNTIATLKSFGGSMLATVTRGGTGAAEPMDATAYLRHAEARGSARRQAALEAAAAMAAPVSASAPAAPATTRRARVRKRAGVKGARESEMLPLNPAAWWTSLQDQFVRAAAAAAAPTPQEKSTESSTAAARAGRRSAKSAAPRAKPSGPRKRSGS